MGSEPKADVEADLPYLSPRLLLDQPNTSASRDPAEERPCLRGMPVPMTSGTIVASDTDGARRV